MPDLSPQSFDDLSMRLLNDETMALRYINTKKQHGTHIATSCDETCRKELYCDTKTSTYTDSRVCQGFEAKDFTTDPGYALVTEAMEPWYNY